MVEKYVLVGLRLKNDKEMSNIIGEIKSNLESCESVYNIEGVEAIDFTIEVGELGQIRNDLAELLEKFK